MLPSIEVEPPAEPSSKPVPTCVFDQTQHVRAPQQNATQAQGASPSSGNGVIPPHKGQAPTPSMPEPGCKRRAPKAIAILALVAVLVAGCGFGVHQWYVSHPVDITLDGAPTTIEGSQRTIQGLIDAGTVTPTPGNHLAVDGSVLKQGGGEAASVKLNGQATSDFATLLMDGDTIEVTNGKDTTEESTEETKTTKPAKADVKLTGTGAIHALSGPSEETVKVVTGKESGLTQTTVLKKSSGLSVKRYNADTKGKKMIALTFDDGPWPTTTDEILDILSSNGAKATFFTIGKQIPNHTSSVKRMKDDGHQICTHTYDHASGSGRGVNITYMTKAEQRAEIEKGMKAIEDVTGDKASKVVRLPGGNVNEETYRNLSDLITAEINWSIDTEDWSRPGADAIYQRLKNASAGSIILMHDGGGDRSQTVAALKKALPELKAQGYSFVTMDELLKNAQ